MQAACVWLCLLAGVSGDTLAWPHDAELSAHPLERALAADCADGRLDSHPLLRAALLAAGETDAANIAQFEEQFEKLAEKLADKLAEKLTNAGAPLDQRARQLLEQMHALILTGDYEAECSDIRRTITTGDYNCVTATLVYQILARRHGLQPRPVAIPAHVFCCLLEPTEVDIQTTCATWLSQNAPVGQTAPGQPEDVAAERRLLSDVEMIGKVYYNRGVLELRSDHFSEAIRVLRISLMLDPDDRIAKNNLLAAINNWSLREAGHERFGTASELLSIGRSMDAEYAPLRANDLHVHQRWVQKLCREGHFSFALGVLEDGLRRQPTAELFDAGRYVVLRLWAADAWLHGDLGDGFALFDARRAAFDQERLRDAEVLAATSAAARLASLSRNATALRLIREAKRRLGDDPRLDKLESYLLSGAKKS